MRLLTKYVLKEHAGPLFFSLSALTSLLLLNYIAKQLSLLVGKGLPWTVIAEFLALSIPFTVAMTLPMAVLVAVLYAFSRLASENEIAAMKANGVAMGRLMLPVAIASVVFAVIMVIFNDQVLPRANHRLATLQRDIAKKKPSFALRERVLNEIIPGKGISLSTDRIDRSRNMLMNVRIYDISEPQTIRTIVADSGEIAITHDQRDLRLVLFNGHMIEVDRQKRDQISRVEFEQNEMRIRDVGNQLEKSGEDGYKGERERTICDMNNIYQVSREEHLRTRHEFKQQMVFLVRQAIRGEVAEFPDTAPPPPEPDNSVGAVYCAGLEWLGKYLPFESTIGGPADGTDTVTVAPAVNTPTAADSARLRQQLAAAAAARKADSIAATNPDSVSAALARQAYVSAQAAASGVPLPKPESTVVIPPANTAPPQPPEQGLTGEQPPVQNPVRLGASPPVSSTAGRRSTAFSQISKFQSSAGEELDGLRLGILSSKQQMDVMAVEIHKKFALAGACIVFVLIGVPFALRFPRGGVGLVIGASLVIFAISYIGLIAGESLAKHGSLSPFLAMWGANIVLGIIGVLMILRMGRESMTRGGSFSAVIDETREWIVHRFRRTPA